MKAINFSERENRMLQEMFIELSQDAQRRQYYELVYQSIITKIESYPEPVLFTEQENRAIQYLYEQFLELCKPFPYPNSPLTFSQPTKQVETCTDTLNKLRWASQ